MEHPESIARTLLHKWLEAVQRRDPAAISALYHPEAQLWGTVAARLYRSPADIRDYFERFLDHSRMEATLLDLDLSCSNGMVLGAGAYQFRWQDHGDAGDADADVVETRARFTFVFGERDGNWSILQHHSSVWVFRGL